jgi:hypothetical protein
MSGIAAAPQWAEVAKGSLAIVQIFAVVLGAAWAYFKFVRGRTFAERLEVSVDAEPFRKGKTSALRIKATMVNTGARIVQFEKDVKVVYVHGVAPEDTAPGVSVDWGQKLVLARVFDDHEWIEAQETISDEVLVTVPSRRLIYQLRLIVASSKKKALGCDRGRTRIRNRRREDSRARRRASRASPVGERRRGADSQGSRGTEREGPAGAGAQDPRARGERAGQGELGPAV